MGFDVVPFDQTPRFHSELDWKKAFSSIDQFEGGMPSCSTSCNAIGPKCKGEVTSPTSFPWVQSGSYRRVCRSILCNCVDDCLMPAFDQTVRLRMIGSDADSLHSVLFDQFLYKSQILRPSIHHDPSWNSMPANHLVL